MRNPNESCLHIETSRSPSDPVWQQIVRAIENVQTAGAKSVRVFLYTRVQYGPPKALRDTLRAYKHLIRSLILPVSSLPDFKRGLGLFLLSPGTPSCAGNLLPVIRKAVQDGNELYVLTGRGVSFDSSLKHSAIPVSYDDFLSTTSIRERLSALIGAVSSYRAILAEFKEDYNLKDKIVQNRSLLICELTQSLIACAAFRKLFREMNPSYLVSPNNLTPCEYMAFEVAKTMDLPSFVIQHGVINSYWWPFEGDYLLVWGKLFHDELSSMGAPATRLGICGMPAADSLFLQSEENAQAAPQNGKLTGLILSQGLAPTSMPELVANYRQFLQEVVTQTGSVQWMVKLHPSESDVFYRELGEETFKSLIILPRSVSLKDAVSRSDFACTLYSTAGLEAMVMRRPLVVFNLSDTVSRFAWWPAHGGGVYVNNPATMCAFIESIRTRPNFLSAILSNQQLFLNRAFEHKGASAGAILEFIKAVISKQMTSDVTLTSSASACKHPQGTV